MKFVPKALRAGLGQVYRDSKPATGCTDDMTNLKYEHYALAPQFARAIRFRVNYLSQTESKFALIISEDPTLGIRLGTLLHDLLASTRRR